MNDGFVTAAVECRPTITSRKTSRNVRREKWPEAFSLDVDGLCVNQGLKDGNVDLSGPTGNRQLFVYGYKKLTPSTIRMVPTLVFSVLLMLPLGWIFHGKMGA